MQDNGQSMLILFVLFVIYAIMLIAGIITGIVGRSKENKNLKLAGIVIFVMALQTLIILGCIFPFLD